MEHPGPNGWKRSFIPTEREGVSPITAGPSGRKNCAPPIPVGPQGPHLPQRKDNATMKIAEVESLLLGGAHFVRITTDRGLVGLGQSGCWAYPEAVDAVVHTFAGYLIGQDPRQIERHWQHVY